MLGCGACCYRAKGNVTKKIRMKNATPSNGGALARTFYLLRKGEPINLGRVAYLKTIKNQDLNRTDSLKIGEVVLLRAIF